MLDGAPLAAFMVAVGNLDSGIFTQFANTQVDTATVNGTFDATGPASLNSKPLHLFVGTGTTVGNSSQYVVLSSNAVQRSQQMFHKREEPHLTLPLDQGYL